MTTVRNEGGTCLAVGGIHQQGIVEAGRALKASSILECRSAGEAIRDFCLAGGALATTIVPKEARTALVASIVGGIASGAVNDGI